MSRELRKIRHRRIDVRRSSMLLATFLIALIVAPVPQPTAAAQCAPPQLEVPMRMSLHRSTTEAIAGSGFVDGCQDLGSCQVGAGCEEQSCDYGHPPSSLVDVDLRLVQGGREWHLGTADAGTGGAEVGAVSWTIDVPADLEPGRAKLMAEHTSPVEVRIR